MKFYLSASWNFQETNRKTQKGGGYKENYRLT